MSRSYRKTPIVKDYNKGTKAIANRRLRRSLIDNELLPQNGNYRKMTETWDICDYSFYVGKDYMIQSCIDYHDMDEDEAYAYWKSKYHSK